MSERVRPRIEVETAEAARLVADPDASSVPAPRLPPSTIGLVAAGCVVLLTGAAMLQAVNLVVDEFARGPVFGWGAASLAVLGFGLIGLGIWREVAGLIAIGRVERLRSRLHAIDATTRVAAARDWVADLPEAPTLLPAIAVVNDPDAVMSLLRAGPVTRLRAAADAMGRQAAMQAAAALTVMPSPAFAALFVAWRGVRLVRQVAALHGLRPGLFGTLRLLRRTVFAATATAGAELAGNAVAHAVLSNPFLQAVAGEVAGAGIAARRLMVLARATSIACSPIDDLE